MAVLEISRWSLSCWLPERAGRSSIRNDGSLPAEQLRRRDASVELKGKFKFLLGRAVGLYAGVIAETEISNSGSRSQGANGCGASLDRH